MTSTLDSPALATSEEPSAGVVETVLDRLRRFPDAIAVADADLVLTAAELDRWTAAVADEIRALLGPDGPRRVGLDLGRGVRHVVGFLAVLRAGCSAVPLDPTAPQRLTQILSAAAPVAVLVDTPAAAAAATRSAPGAVRRLAIDPLRRQPARQHGSSLPQIRPEDEAYLLFTSGSTGVPKGVRIPHSALAAFTRSMVHLLGITESDRVLALTATTFDPSVMEMFCALTAGAPLQVAGAAERTDPVLLQDFCLRHRISYGFFPVAVLPLLEPTTLPMLRVLHTGAEAPGPEQVERWTAGSDRRFINSYGPTETTIAVCSWEATGTWSSALPIGRPHSGHHLVIVDPDSLRPVPFGDDGELLIAGPGLAIGYLDDPVLTAARFVVLDGVRYYRSGDRCRWNPDHTVQFLGRTDRQVKVRGHRVELGEVEAALTAHPAVLSAVVDTDRGPEGTRRLVAHHTGRVGADELADWLRDRLPPAMIPAELHSEDSLPRNASDKIDLQALAARRAARTAAPSAAAAAIDDCAPDTVATTPADDVVGAVLQLWTDHVGPVVEGAGLYACGGSSVAAMTLVAQIRRRTSRTVRTVEVLRAPDAATLARLVAARSPETDTATNVPAESATTGAAAARATVPSHLSAAQQRLWLTEVVSGSSHESNIAVAHLLVGALDQQALRTALAGLPHLHPALQWCFPEVGGRGTIALGAQPDPPLTLRSVPAGGVDAAVRELVRQRFDIAAGPLWNATLLREDGTDDRHVLVVTVHHLVCDGWSVGPLVDDLAAGYRAALAGGTPTDSPTGSISRSFADHVEREQIRHREEGPADQLWWAGHLAGTPDVIEWADPATTPHPAVGTEQPIGEHTASLHRDRPALEEAARSLTASTAAVLLAALGVLLRHRTGCDEVVVGLVVAGRDHPDSVRAVGMFSDIVPVVLRPGSAPTFRAAVLAAEQELRDTADHGAIPLQEIARAAGARRVDGRGTLVQVLLNLYNFPLPVPDLGGPTVTAVEVPASGSPFDLTVYVQPDPSSSASDRRSSPPMVARTVLRPDVVPNGDTVAQAYADLLAELIADPVAPLQIPVPASLTVAAAAPQELPIVATDTAFHDTGLGRRATAAVPPATPTERALVAIWALVLQSEISGVTDNFFDVGGHSLAVAEVRAGIAAQWGRDVSMVDLFAWPTIREIADRLDAAPAATRAAGAPVPPTGTPKTTSAPVDRGAARRAAARRSPRTAPQRRERP